MNISPSGQACGAHITGLDLSKPLPTNTLQGIRDAWLEHHVLAFPDQRLDDEDLVGVTQALGDVGDDPFFVPISKKTPVVALTRRADEQAPVFAENWHTDWSFKKYPPIGTCLYSLVVPPVGGNTGFANQQMALAQMPDGLRNRLEGKVALHSAAAAYGPQGTYGEKDQGNDRSMKILFSEQANKSEPHPIVVKHPESGNDTLFGTVGYIHTIVGLEEDQSRQLIMDLFHWQTREEFQYTHVWEPNTLVVWDNRSVLHRAYGGYDGYARELHRLTIAGSAALSL
jgi:taurine dioxygenase